MTLDQTSVIYDAGGASMVVDYGFLRETTLSALVIDLGCGAGKVQCAECEGTGDWSRFYPADMGVNYPDPCVVCKGQGWHLVSV